MATHSAIAAMDDAERAERLEASRAIVECARGNGTRGGTAAPRGVLRAMTTAARLTGWRLLRGGLQPGQALLEVRADPCVH